MSDIAELFHRDSYAVLPRLLQDPQLCKIYKYVRKIAQSGLMAIGDEQVVGTPYAYAYGDLIMDGLLASLQKDIELAAGIGLFPTFSYLRVYKCGDILKRHTDRPAAEISVSLCLGYEAEKAWPICIEGPRGPSRVSLEPGDALLYRGMDCPHWREAFTGKLLAQVFLHYVDKNGPHASWKFDKRASLTALQRPNRPSSDLKDESQRNLAKDADASASG
jgi:hypothetical protein